MRSSYINITTNYNKQWLRLLTLISSIPGTCCSFLISLTTHDSLHSRYFMCSDQHVKYQMPCGFPLPSSLLLDYHAKQYAHIFLHSVSLRLLLIIFLWHRSTRFIYFQFTVFFSLQILFFPGFLQATITYPLLSFCKLNYSKFLPRVMCLAIPEFSRIPLFISFSCKKKQANYVTVVDISVVLALFY